MHGANIKENMVHIALKNSDAVSGSVLEITEKV
jgi:hypothetical protein